jgi:hypothetical protein
MYKYITLIAAFFYLEASYCQGVWQVSNGNVTTNTSSRVFIQNLSPNNTSMAELTVERTVPMFSQAQNYIPQSYFHIGQKVANNGVPVPVLASTIFNINDQGYIGVGTLPSSSFDLRFPATLNFKVFNFQSKATQRNFFYSNKLGLNAYSYMSQLNDQGIFWSDGDSVVTEQTPILNEVGEETGQMQTNYYYHNKTSGFVIAPYLNASKGIRISADGNVGIGTADAFGAKLAVNGSIYCKDELIISNSSYAWPDYVFADYFSGKKLKPLSLLKSEIKELGHLPELPSSKTIEQKGINTTELITTLLKKVEELTLYTIEQHEEIEQLKAKQK